MYFLMEFLQRQESLTAHQVWILILVTGFALLLTAAAPALRDQEGHWDGMLIVNALLMWGLVFDRVLIVIRYEFLIYEEYEQFYSVWTPFRHLSLLCIELPIYALAFTFLSPPIRRWLKSRLNGWLRDA